MASRSKTSASKKQKSSPGGKSGASRNGSASGSSEKAEMLELFRQMYLIRQFEVACGENYARGHIRGFLHLYIGQEATAVGAISALGPDDYIVTHYRDHGHALARGLDVNRAMAELFGRRTGLSKGKGGSMHLFDVGKKFMGGHAIVGGQFPLACGLALSQQYNETDGVTICFLGDGSANQGTYHEALNLAAVWKLPVLFLMENNGFGMGSAIERVRAGGTDFYPAVESYGIDAAVVDGMDVLAVREATQLAVEKIRAGNGPVFIEAKTYRFQGHSMADGQKYRSREDIREWEANDPLSTFPELLSKQGLASKSDLDSIKKDIDSVVADAVKFAEESPNPDPDELFDDIYAD